MFDNFFTFLLSVTLSEKYNIINLKYHKCSTNSAHKC